MILGDLTGDVFMRTEIIELLKREVKPAMGCTEPVAVTLACAKAREIAGANLEDIVNVKVSVSPNIFKNGLGVGIPFCDLVGLDVAAAIGLAGGESELGLEIFESVNCEITKNGRTFMESGKIQLGVADTDVKVYIAVEIEAKENRAKVVIEGMHNHYSLIQRNEDIILEKPFVSESSAEVFSIESLTINEILDEVEQSDVSELEFLYEGFEMNGAIALKGLEEKRGMGVGYAIMKEIEEGILCDDLSLSAMYMTAAASDARMSGITLPVMSSNGSGNNGLTAILPLYAYTKYMNNDKEEIVKGLAISHLINCYIKSYIGRLSAVCSCGISAATAAGAAIAWMMTKSRDVIEGTIMNMIGNLSGMICDGAKNGCALKLATAASLAVHSAILSKAEAVINKRTGIVGNDAEESIQNLGELSRRGMQLTDTVILDIMSSMHRA